VAVVSVVDVSSRDLSAERLRGYHIDLPVTGSQTEGYTFDILGWVLGRYVPTIAVEIVCEGDVLRRVPIDVRRPDIGAAFPEVAGAEHSGFQITLNKSELAPDFELIVQTVLGDEGRVQIGVIRGQRNSISDEIRISDVSMAPTDLSAPLWGSHIDLPHSGSQTQEYAISLEGWAVGRFSPAVAVELVNENVMFRRIPINISRPDVVAQYPTLTSDLDCGFRAKVNVLGLTPEFELFARVVLQDGNRIPIGVIRARRQRVSTSFEPKLWPLMVTTYGRTGSTWLMHLLGKHPSVITYRPFEFEPRVSSYWMQVLKTLSEPTSYFQTLATELNHDLWWLGDNSALAELTVPDPQIQQWLGRSNIEASAAFCQERIEKFYEQVSSLQGRTDIRYFAEKYSPTRFDRTMLQEIYPKGREIMLIRDFRDMVCSILAYSAKQQHTSFGREQVESDEDFIWRIGSYAKNLLRDYTEWSAQLHLARYEDLVLRPVDTLRAILEYLKLDAAPSTVESMLQRASEKLSGQEQHRTSPDPQRSIGRWRHDLDPALQAVCQESFGDVLEEFGYTD
jgi:hypothetical protein